MALLFNTGNQYNTPSFTYNGDRIGAFSGNIRFDVMGQTPSNMNEEEKHTDDR